jgi:hypothetical protein
VRDIIDNPLPQLIYSWNSLSDHNKLVLSSLGASLEGGTEWAGAGTLITYLRRNKAQLPFQKERMLMLLEEAYHKEYLEKEREQYRFRMDLLRRWIRREHSIWKVARETGLSFKRRFNPWVAVGATAGVLLIAAGALYTLQSRGYGIFRPAESEASDGARTADASAQVADQAVQAVNAVVLKANRGPFRVVVDDSLNLTSAGQDNELIITIPEMSRGIHRFVFHDPRTEEEISLEANITRDGQGIEVLFTAQRETTAQPEQKPAAEQPQTGTVLVSSIPPGASITLDGEWTGLKTPNLIESLALGRHEIKLSLEGYRDQTLELEVAAGKTEKQELTLEVSYGLLVLDVRPTAQIFLDGNPLVETPYVQPIEIQSGDHTLTIVNEAMEIRLERDILIEEGETLRIVEVLK